MKKANILITGVSSSNALSFIKGLRNQREVQVSITGTDIYQRSLSAGASFVDFFSRVPLAGDKNYIPAIINICKKNKIDIIVPIIDEEFIFISCARKKFQEIGARVMLPEHSQLLLCRDKYKTYLFLKEHGIPTPATSLNFSATKRYPVLAKPRFGRGSKDIRTIYSKEDINGLRLRSFIFQEIVKGQEYSIDTLSDLNGRVVAVVPRLRLEIRNGTSYKAKTVKSRMLEEMCAFICTKLGLKGPACIQCMVTPKGAPYFFEINPRIGSAVALTIRAGINIPLLAVKNILGMKLDNLVGEFQEDVIMLRYWDEVFNKEPAYGNF